MKTLQSHFPAAILLLFTSTLQAAIPAGERAALEALYNSTNGANWTDNSGWMGAAGTECSWYGVSCDTVESHVLQLVLNDNKLTGTLPAQLSNLGALQILKLSNNQLGGAIPLEFGNLADLQLLSLTNNRLTGSIPVELADLPKLIQLHLNRNELSGAIPSQLGNLDLIGLNLTSNRLTGNIPPELGNLIHIRYLYLNSNRLSGSIPVELGKLTDVQNLILADNQLTGPIPATFGNLSQLRLLNLSGNHLSGNIPVQFGELAELRWLSLSANQLSGSVPAELGKLDKLQMLNISYNQLSGSIPSGLGNLSTLENNQSDLSYNALYTTDAALDTFLDSKQWGGDWSATQTVAPVNVTFDGKTHYSLELTWDLIEYTNLAGGYHVYYHQAPSGPPLDGGATSDKGNNTLLVAGLSPATEYCFVVRTWTDPHDIQQNLVWSENSAEVCASTFSDADSDNDGLPDYLDQDECVTTALTILTPMVGPTRYDGSGNTQLKSEVRIDTEDNGTIEVRAPHLLILEAPEVEIVEGVTFHVEEGAGLQITGGSLTCP